MSTGSYWRNRATMTMIDPFPIACWYGGLTVGIALGAAVTASLATLLAGVTRRS